MTSCQGLIGALTVGLQRVAAAPRSSGVECQATALSRKLPRKLMPKVGPNSGRDSGQHSGHHSGKGSGKDSGKDSSQDSGPKLGQQTASSLPSCRAQMSTATNG